MRIKVLFIARHTGYLRNFDGVIRRLAARGHTVRLAVEKDDRADSHRLMDGILAEYPNVSLVAAPTRAKEESPERVRLLRLAIDYIRFKDPLYNRAPHLRTRAEERAPDAIIHLLETPVIRRKPFRAMVDRTLRWLERALPVSVPIAEWLRAEAPDVLMVTPLIELGSPQLDYLQAAQSLGIRTVLPVTSWDHLSSKAPIRGGLDLVLVWNQTQKNEAIRMHGVPSDRITITGAQAYDHWFTWTPKRSRAEFCAHLGLPQHRPFLVYVCSSLFRGTADETVFVDKWIRAVRESPDPNVRNASILIRPHPARIDDWSGFNFRMYRDVYFWGGPVVDDQSRGDYYESLTYSAAVVGLNTSAFLEAALLGRPVYTVLLAKYSRANQTGTLHFHYLMDGKGGGLLHVARSFEEHVEQLGEPLATHVEEDPKSRRFTETFIRPLGIAVAATPKFVEAVEALSARPASPPRPVPARYLALWLLPRVMRTLRRKRRGADKDAALGPGGARKRNAAARAKREAIGGASALSPRPGKMREQKVLSGSETLEAQFVREEIVRLAESGKPILVGPWLSEAGFELMYWIPFVAWAKRYGKIDPSRLVVVSRGGTAPWYAGVTTEYEEVLLLYSPDEFRQRNDARIEDTQGVQKHVALSPFDREIVERVARARGFDAYEVLHPSVMYRLFNLFWRQYQPITIVEMFTSYALIAPAPSEADIRRHLPDRYIAAKFYGNVALPDTPENHSFVAATLAALSADRDVVLLNTGVRFDDHADLGPAARGRLHSVEHLMTPETNLAVQSAIIRHAEAYVGTYGGFSYLAPMLGTDAVTFYSNPEAFRFDHLEVAKRVFAGLGGGGFSEVDIRHVRALQAAFGGALRRETVIR